MFSRATLMDTMFLLRDMNTHVEISTFAFRYGLEGIAVGNNKDERVLSIGRHLINNPELPGILGSSLTYEIVEHIINAALSNPYNVHFDKTKNEFINYPQLRRLLLKDGFRIEDYKLIRAFEMDMNFIENESLLEKLLDKHNFEVAKGHYEQAGYAFNRGDWAACNSQLRSYVEDLLNRIAEQITGTTFVDSQSARTALSQCNPPIFYRELNEWLDNGQGFFETFWKRLHPQGSHPGLSDEDDSIFRLNLVQITTLEVLRRYDENYN